MLELEVISDTMLPKLLILQLRIWSCPLCYIAVVHVLSPDIRVPVQKPSSPNLSSQGFLEDRVEECFTLWVIPLFNQPGFLSKFRFQSRMERCRRGEEQHSGSWKVDGSALIPLSHCRWQFLQSIGSAFSNNATVFIWWSTVDKRAHTHSSPC